MQTGFISVFGNTDAGVRVTETWGDIVTGRTLADRGVRTNR
jgi:hypothetical protein